jgi:transcriptional regulator with XRE-family HTH domain
MIFDFPGGEVVTIKKQSVGEILRHWRRLKSTSQMQLALDSGTSSRHLSCVETGRAQASSALLLRLAEVLDMPLRARNSLLNTAGFKSYYSETGLSEPEMAEARQVLEKILQSHQPYPAMLLDPCFNILLYNQAFDYLVRYFIKDNSVIKKKPWNMMQLIFHPDGWAPYIENLEEVFRANIDRARQGLSATGENKMLSKLVNDMADWCPKEYQAWETRESESLPKIVLPVHYLKNTQRLSLFTTTATLGSPNSITLRELQIESGYPINEAGEMFFKNMNYE